MIADVFVALYVGHMVGDHLAQTDEMAANKAKSWRAMAGHIIGYGLCQWVALVALALLPGDSSIRGPGYAAALVVSLATHAFIDRRWPVLWVMNRTGSSEFAATKQGTYLVDQSLHIGCLFVAAWLAAFLSGAGA